jgi:two-component system cell cycle response regulator DivK
MRSDAGEMTAPALILVVDDTEDNRTIFRMCLEDAGYRLDEAVDGLDALAHIERDKPALVVMDLSMPVMDGWEATRRIKANPATSDIRILIVSGHATGDFEARARSGSACRSSSAPPASCVPSRARTRCSRAARTSSCST